MITTEEEKDLVWLPKSLAADIKALESPYQMQALIAEYIEESKRDVKLNLENLDDSLITYKAQMISARNKFEEAKNKELDANYAMWEKFEEERPKIQEKVKSLIAELQPLKDELNGLKKALEGIHTYDIEKLVELVKAINYNFHGETGEILKFLFNNYKK